MTLLERATSSDTTTPHTPADLSAPDLSAPDQSTTDRSTTDRSTTDDTTPDAAATADVEMPAILAAIPVPPITLAKAMAVSVAVCSVVIALGIALAVWITRGEPLQGLGLGLFCALWGGPGFGLMGGGAVHAISQERAARLDAATRAADA